MKILLNLSMAAMLSTAMFALSDKEVEDHMSGLFPQEMGAKVTVFKSFPLKDDNQTTVHYFQIEDNNLRIIRDVAFSRGDFIFAEMLNVKTKQSMKKFYNGQILQKVLLPMIKAENPENIVMLGDDKNKPTKIIFSDPECPYCREELKNIEKQLETHNVKMILTPVHAESAMKKVAYILDEQKQAKDDLSKIAVLRKYYAEEAEALAHVDNKRIAELNNLKQKYFKAGIKGVPFIMEEDFKDD